MNNSKLPEKYQHTINTFNGVADEYLAYFKDFKPYQKSYEWLLQAMKRHHSSVLDIACGPGQIDHYLMQNRPDLQITGIDLAPNMIALAKQLNPECQYKVLDARDIHLLGLKFDVIICGFCLPYLSHDDMYAMLDSMIEVTQVDGLIYLSTTTSDEPDGYQTSKSAKGKTYVHYHDIERIKSQLEKAGCSLLQHEQIVHMHNDKETKDELVLVSKNSSKKR